MIFSIGQFNVSKPSYIVWCSGQLNVSVKLYVKQMFLESHMYIYWVFMSCLYVYFSFSSQLFFCFVFFVFS